VAIGDRLGYYRALDAEPRTAAALAGATGTHERYAREWLEQQAMTGYLRVSDGVFALAPGTGEALARPGTSSWVAPMLRQFAVAAGHWTDIAAGASTGSGFSWAGFGRDMFESQSDVNAGQLLESLAGTWLPAAVPDLHARMAECTPEGVHVSWEHEVDSNIRQRIKQLMHAEVISPALNRLVRSPEGTCTRRMCSAVLPRKPIRSSSTIYNAKRRFRQHVSSISSILWGRTT